MSVKSHVKLMSVIRNCRGVKLVGLPNGGVEAYRILPSHSCDYPDGGDGFMVVTVCASQELKGDNYRVSAAVLTSKFSGPVGSTQAMSRAEAIDAVNKIRIDVLAKMSSVPKIAELNAMLAPYGIELHPDKPDSWATA
jgi:hypothetical protein